MPAYSVPGYNPKTDSQPTYYDVSKEIAYLNKLKANFYKKYPDKKLKEYNDPVMGHVIEYQATDPDDAWQNEVVNPYVKYCIDNGYFKDIKTHFSSSMK